MGEVADRWRRWWYPAVPLERVAIFRLFITGFAFVDVVYVSNYMLQYSGVDRSFFEPVFLLELPSLLGLGFDPVPTPRVHYVIYAVMIIALLSSFVGYRTRLALAVAAPLYLYHWSLFNSWGKVNHGKIPAVIALLALIVAPAACRYSLDAWRQRRDRKTQSTRAEATHDPLGGWVLRVVGVVVVGAYLLSFVAKLMNAGIGWPLQPVVRSSLLGSPGPLADMMIDLPGLLILGQIVTMVAEVAAVFAFVGGWRRNLVLGILAIFHLTSYALLETEFTGFLICFAVFFRLEEIPVWMRAQLGPMPQQPLDTG